MTILNYLSVRFLQQLLLGNFKLCHAMPHRSIAACTMQHRSQRVAIPDSCTRTKFSTCTKFKFRNKYKYVCHTRLTDGGAASIVHAASICSVQGRTHAAAIRHRSRDLVSTLFMARRCRTAFVSQRAWRVPTLLHAKEL